jgi:transcription initiation factor TFIIB
MGSNQSSTVEERDGRVGTVEGQLRECPECGSTDLVESQDRDERFCGECGLVVDASRIDRGPEWRAYTTQERWARSRVGAPSTALLHDRGLTTTIGWQDRDSSGKPLGAEQRRRLERLRTWQARIRTDMPGERNLELALSEIERMGSALEVPRSTRERAGTLYREALDADIPEGRAIESVAAAALYAACRADDIPRSLHEIAEVSRVARDRIARTSRQLVATLDLRLPPVDPKRYVPRFCTELGLGSEAASEAQRLLDRAAESGERFSGKAPTGVAAGAVYTAAYRQGDDVTQDEAASVSGVTAFTVRERHKELTAAIDDS